MYRMLHIYIYGIYKHIDSEFHSKCKQHILSEFQSLEHVPSIAIHILKSRTASNLQSSIHPRLGEKYISADKQEILF